MSFIYSLYFSFKNSTILNNNVKTYFYLIELEGVA